MLYPWAHLSTDLDLLLVPVLCGRCLCVPLWHSHAWPWDLLICTHSQSDQVPRETCSTHPDPALMWMESSAAVQILQIAQEDHLLSMMAFDKRQKIICTKSLGFSCKIFFSNNPLCKLSPSLSSSKERAVSTYRTCCCHLTL